MDVGVLLVTAAGTPPTATEVAGYRLVPLIVVVVPPTEGPEDGTSSVTVGALEVPYNHVSSQDRNGVPPPNWSNLFVPGSYATLAS